MILTDFLLKISSRINLFLIFFLLATTFLLAQPSDPIVGSYDTEAEAPIDDACKAESFDCNVDTTCTSCITGGMDNAAVAKCYDGHTALTVEDGCAANMEGLCCLVKLSGFDCLANEAFMDLEICRQNSRGCKEPMACDDTEVVSGPDANLNLPSGSSMVTGISCAFLLMLPLLWALLRRMGRTGVAIRLEILQQTIRS